MFKTNKKLTIFALIAFLVGMLVGGNWKNFKAGGVAKRPDAEKSPKTESSSGTVLTLSAESQDDLDSFAKRLEGNLSENDYDKLFDEALKSRSAQSPAIIPQNKKMALLLAKWGTSNRKAALEKIHSVSKRGYLVWLAFEVWSRKDIEATVAFFEESQDHPLVKGDSSLISVIAGNWAKFAPEKAWDWLQSQNGKTVSGNRFLQCRDYFISTLIGKDPKQIAPFFEKLDEGDFQRNARRIGIALAENEELFAQFIKKLTPESQIEAEAGRIMTVSNGELEKAKELTARLADEKQVKVIEMMAGFLLERICLDMDERVSWVVEKLPEDKWPNYLIEKWLKDDREDAHAWVESLPAGPKKEKLLQFCARKM